MWTVPHFLQVRLLRSPIVYRLLLRVLRPVTRPTTTLDCVLLNDNNQAPLAMSGSEINSQACICVPHGPHHNTKYCFSIKRFIFLLTFCLETPKKGSDPTNLWKEPSLASLLAISFPRAPACPGSQYSPTVWWVEISFKAFWYSHTNWDVVLAAWSAFKAAWLSEQTLTYFSGLSWVSIS